MLGYEIRHQGCSGLIKGRGCEKCGTRWGFVAYLSNTDWYYVKGDTKGKVQKNPGSLKRIHKIGILGLILVIGFFLIKKYLA